MNQNAERNGECWIMNLLFPQMYETKQIIISRLSQIAQFEQKTDGTISADKINFALLQKSSELDRVKRESEALASLGKEASLGKADANQQLLLREMGAVIFDICCASGQEIKQTPVGKGQIYEELWYLFSRSGYKEKLHSLQFLSEKEFDLEICVTLMTMLAEWSRKKLAEALKNKLKVRRIARDTPYATIDVQSDERSANRHQMQKMVPFFTRATVHGYIVKQLKAYYKIIGIEDVDRSYVRGINKRGNKESLLLQVNIKRAVEVLTTNVKENKNIRDARMQFSQELSNNRESKKPSGGSRKKTQIEISSTSLVEKISKTIQPIAKDFSQPKNAPERISASETPQAKGPNPILRKRFKTLDEIEPVKLPEICRPKKEHPVLQWETQSIIRFPTESVLEADNSKSPWAKNQMHMRSSIKGIIIKNFLSNRENILRNKDGNKIGIQINSLTPVGDQEKLKKWRASAELRQKSKAILRNFKIPNKET